MQWGVFIWLLGAWAGLRCHGRQCAIGDYYRNIHLYYLLGKSKAELDSSDKIREEMRQLKWKSKDWFNKLYLYFYARYTGSQEDQVKAFHIMKKSLEEKYGEQLPEQIREEFCKYSKKLMPLTNILTFDTRAIVMFLSLGFDVPWLYFVFESVVLEALRFYMIRKHEELCARITQQYV
jgi:hypothetical protein